MGFASDLEFVAKAVRSDQTSPRVRAFKQCVGTDGCRENQTRELVLAGSAGLCFEGEAEVRVLSPGDYVLIPAHLKHRVEWTNQDRATIWLAVHYPETR